VFSSHALPDKREPAEKAQEGSTLHAAPEISVAHACSSQAVISTPSRDVLVIHFSLESAMHSSTVPGGAESPQFQTLSHLATAMSSHAVSRSGQQPEMHERTTENKNLKFFTLPPQENVP